MFWVMINLLVGVYCIHIAWLGYKRGVAETIFGSFGRHDNVVKFWAYIGSGAVIGALTIFRVLSKLS